MSGSSFLDNKELIGRGGGPTRAGAAAPLPDASEDAIWEGPAEIGVWLFILGDMSLFAVLFVAYALAFREQPLLFAESQRTLSLSMGISNVLLLLTGSLLVVLALHQLKFHRGARSRLFLSLAMATGLLFIVNKYFEYSAKVAGGHTPMTNDFFLYYYLMTGIHLLHVVIGMGVLLYMYRRLGQDTPAAQQVTAMESAGAVWHMVDLLWIALFPLLYLVN